MEVSPGGSWSSLFDFAKEFRDKNRITATELMIHLDLPLTMIQYLYNPKITPSKKKNTKGYHLREKLRTLKLKMEQHPHLESEFRVQEGRIKFPDRMYDFEMRFKEEFNQIGIESFFCSEENGEKSILAIVRKDLSVDEITNKLHELGFTETPCAVSAQKFDFSSHFESPCCMGSSGVTHGTGNFLLVDIGLIG
jgi:hypothetical protein